MTGVDHELDAGRAPEGRSAATTPGWAAWREATPRARLEHVLSATFWSLLIVGVVAAGLAGLHVVWRDAKAVHLAVDVLVLGPLAWLVLYLAIYDPRAAPREDLASLSSVPHFVATAAAIVLVPWILLAGILGADLSTRPEVYAEIGQILPVLLLAVVVERRFFDVASVAPVDRLDLRFGFFVLILGSLLAEVLALLAMASHVRWIEAMATVTAGATIPGLLLLIAVPGLIGLYSVAEEKGADVTGEPGAQA
jgi:hypothetical protein